MNKKPTKKQIAARRAFARAAKEGRLKKGAKLGTRKNPAKTSRAMSGANARKRKEARGRKTASSLYTARKAKTPRFYVVARVKDGDSYAFQYYDGNRTFLDTKRGAKRYATKRDAMEIARGILPRLPVRVLDLRIEKA